MTRSLAAPAAAGGHDRGMSAFTVLRRASRAAGPAGLAGRTAPVRPSGDGPAAPDQVRAPVPAPAPAAASCALAGVVTAVLGHYTEADMAALLAMPPMAAFFSYTAGKRTEMVATLRQTRAELARIAVSEERLRIARDLHDLLGHSLSLIALKAELSRRLISTDTERAGREIAELEAVARQSLSDVRGAVAGYRQPDLASELAAARQLLTAAGIACRIAAPQGLDLPAGVDAVLAWTVREGVTNVVRHSDRHPPLPGDPGDHPRHPDRHRAEGAGRTGRRQLLTGTGPHGPSDAAVVFAARRRAGCR
jgi:Histidine kinase